MSGTLCGCACRPGSAASARGLGQGQPGCCARRARAGAGRSEPEPAAPPHSGSNPVTGPHPHHVPSRRSPPGTPPPNATTQGHASACHARFLATSGVLGLVPQAPLPGPRGRDSEFSGKLWRGLDTRPLRVRDQNVWGKVSSCGRLAQAPWLLSGGPPTVAGRGWHPQSGRGGVPV